MWKKKKQKNKVKKSTSKYFQLNQLQRASILYNSELEADCEESVVGVNKLKERNGLMLGI